MTADLKGKIAIAVAGVVGVGGAMLGFYDAAPAALVITGVGALIVGKGWSRFALAGALLAAGLAWSAAHPAGCSAWWRGNLLASKLTGGFDYVSWGDLFRSAMRPCEYQVQLELQEQGSLESIDERIADGQEIRLFRTRAGDFWAPPAESSLDWILWELHEEHTYESGDIHVREGDVVLDCGAHVGTFSRWALDHGAAKVIAVEPDPRNLAALRANLADGIAAGKVEIFEGGVWHEEGTLDLNIRAHSTAATSFMEASDTTEVVTVRVATIDTILAELGVDHVDFVKMDIEGAERHALRGASKLLARDRPQMAICTYHRTDDPQVVPVVVKEANDEYRYHAKDVDMDTLNIKQYQPKVFFFAAGARS